MDGIGIRELAMEEDTLVNSRHKSKTPGRNAMERESRTLQETDAATDHAELTWDDSPEQFQLSNTLTDPDLLHEQIQCNTENEESPFNHSLTDLDSIDDDVFPTVSPLTLSNRLKRTNAFRKGRSGQHTALTGDSDTGAGTAVEEHLRNNHGSYREARVNIQLDKCQRLETVLNPRVPLAPEAIQPHPSVQNVTYPLLTIDKTSGNHQGKHKDRPSRLPRRTTRSSIDYKQYDSTGRKLPSGTDTNMDRGERYRRRGKKK